MNAMEESRLRLPLVESARVRMNDKPDRTRNTICRLKCAAPAWALSPQIARYSGWFSKLPGWKSGQAWVKQGQLAWYRAMEECGEMVQLRTGSEVEAHAARWRAATAEDMAKLPIGYPPSLVRGTPSRFRRHLAVAGGPASMRWGRCTMGPACTARHR
jgi:membrane dipeptidase